MAAEAALVAIDSMVPCFQPVVDLGTGSVVGIEALARWPTVENVNPAEVFALARSSGIVSDIDFACRKAAIREACSIELTAGLALYLNYEPSGISDPELTEIHLDALECGLDVVLEITERGLGTNPEQLRSMVRSARRRGFSIALDDVGSNAATLEALSVVEPDIVKLDSHLVRHPHSFRSLRAKSAVRRYVAATGAVVLAEGIESELDRRRAVRLGATLGQGWLFGRATTSRDLSLPR